MGECTDMYAGGEKTDSKVISLMEELTGYMYQASDYERSEQYDYMQEEAWSILDIIQDDLLPMLEAEEYSKSGKSMGTGKATPVRVDTSDLATK